MYFCTRSLLTGHSSQKTSGNVFCSRELPSAQPGTSPGGFKPPRVHPPANPRSWTSAGLSRGHGHPGGDTSPPAPAAAQDSTRQRRRRHSPAQPSKARSDFVCCNRSGKPQTRACTLQPVSKTEQERWKLCADEQSSELSASHHTCR